MPVPVEYKIAFASLKGLNMTLGRHLLSLVGDEENFFKATESQLGAVIGSNNRLLSRQMRESVLDDARREAAYIDSGNIDFKYFTDDDFPTRLLDCDDAPMGLYTVGDCDLNSMHAVSIVGTRHTTPYGLSFINSLVEELARKIENIVIISGLAYGADIAAHRAAMSNAIPTAAVFGHGLNMIYPAQHRDDAARIVRSGGIVITEYPHTARIHKGNFLARNRIVAALSDCTVVSESAIKGGALVTAGIASRYGRDVFALPGRTSDIYSRGCNHLIATNVAALIESADDLIDAMRWSTKPQEGDQQEMLVELDEDQRKVIDYLREHSEAQINRLSVETGMTIGKLMSVLVDLEFNGIILNYPGGLYRLA